MTEKEPDLSVETNGLAGENAYSQLEPTQTQPTAQQVDYDNTETTDEANDSKKWIAGVIRTDRGTKHYEKVFGAEVAKPDGMILDMGAGDSNFAQTVNESESEGNLKVVRYDYSYGDDPPDYKTGAVTGLAQELPFADGSFDKVVDSFMMMHIRKEDVPKVLSEMIRVTKPGGEIMLFPSQNMRLPKNLRGKDFLSIKYKSKVDPRYRTLKIRKDPTISEQEWSQIAQQLDDISKLPAFLDSYQRLLMKLHIKLKGTRRIHKRGF